METLEFTAVTGSGRAWDLRFPLHPMTGSGEGVAGVLTDVLAATSTALGRHPGTRDGDVLQALAMALAIRARMADDTGRTTAPLTRQLVDEALAAALQARSYAAARA